MDMIEAAGQLVRGDVLDEPQRLQWLASLQDLFQSDDPERMEHDLRSLSGRLLEMAGNPEVLKTRDATALVRIIRQVAAVPGYDRTAVVLAEVANRHPEHASLALGAYAEFDAPAAEKLMALRDAPPQPVAQPTAGARHRVHVCCHDPHERFG